MPTFVLPELNDGVEAPQPQLTAYEYANSRWNNTLYDWTLEQIMSFTPRSSMETIVFGTDYNTTSSFKLTSYDLPDMGCSVIRSSSTSYLMMKYGPHGGWHGHYDKGAIVLYKVNELK